VNHRIASTDDGYALRYREYMNQHP